MSENAGQDFAQQMAIQDRHPDNHDAFHNYITRDSRLTATGIATVYAGVSVIEQAIHRYAVSKGWWPTPETDRNFGEVLALIHSEVTEALEAFRDGDEFEDIKYAYKTPDGGVIYSEDSEDADSGELGKPEGIASEMADVIIRVLDACCAFNIPVGEALVKKHAYNTTREYRHGNKKA